MVDHDDIVIAHNHVVDTSFNLRIPTGPKNILCEGLATVRGKMIFWCGEANDVKPACTLGASMHVTIPVAVAGRSGVDVIQC